MTTMKYMYSEYVRNRNGKYVWKFRKTKNLELARNRASKSSDGNYYYWKIVSAIGFPAGNAIPVRVNVIEAEYKLNE